jgi:L-alanine-DL-glutamate epimerase-like enolase superfamily enzyme
MEARITAARPKEVAVEVERALRRGFTSFVVRSIDNGGMLDMERMGAARYAAGVHADVQLRCSATTAAVASGSSN